MTTNISTIESFESRISKLLALIGQPARIQILLVLGAEEACVCHLEVVLGMRQASISQHLMVLRKAGLVCSHRDGRNIFYRLARPEILQVIDQAVQALQLDPQAARSLGKRPVSGCPCPQCNPGMDPNLTCRSLQSSVR